MPAEGRLWPSDNDDDDVDIYTYYDAVFVCVSVTKNDHFPHNIDRLRFFIFQPRNAVIVDKRCDKRNIQRISKESLFMEKRGGIISNLSYKLKPWW